MNNNISWATTADGPYISLCYNDYLYVVNSGACTIGKISLLDPNLDNNESWIFTGTGATPQSILIYNTNGQDYMYIVTYGPLDGITQTNGTIGQINLSGNPTYISSWVTTAQNPIQNIIHDNYMYVLNIGTSPNYGVIGKINMANSQSGMATWIILGLIPIQMLIYDEYMYVLSSDVDQGTTISKINLSNPSDIELTWARVDPSACWMAIYNCDMYICNNSSNTISKIDFES